MVLVATVGIRESLISIGRSDTSDGIVALTSIGADDSVGCRLAGARVSSVASDTGLPVGGDSGWSFKLIGPVVIAAADTSKGRWVTCIIIGMPEATGTSDDFEVVDAGLPAGFEDASEFGSSDIFLVVPTVRATVAGSNDASDVAIGNEVTLRLPVGNGVSSFDPLDGVGA